MLVLSLVLIGLAITLEPIPLTAFILILASEGGVRKGAAFIFGWLVSLAIVIAFTVLVTGNNPPKPSTAPSLAALAAKLAIGAGLVVIAIRYYRKLGKPKPPKKPPRWQTHIDNMTPWYAVGQQQDGRGNGLSCLRTFRCPAASTRHGGSIPGDRPGS